MVIQLKLTHERVYRLAISMYLCFENESKRKQAFIQQCNKMHGNEKYSFRKD